VSPCPRFAATALAALIWLGGCAAVKDTGELLYKDTATDSFDGRYPGFNPPQASRLKRVDGCFGAFIADLKAPLRG